MDSNLFKEAIAQISATRKTFYSLVSYQEEKEDHIIRYYIKKGGKAKAKRLEEESGYVILSEGKDWIEVIYSYWLGECCK